ncbi:MAG TPA: NAD(P)H-hydrate dehydratase [Patescibacteria group bacterium]|nr:NAD(P)H-hydrate dehydratase [Patescibacteria group bacterium]
MDEFNPELLKKLYKPASDSHKGENGKVMIIAGSHLFHAASIWPLTVASRIVDMVFYSSVETNNKIIESIKAEFRDGIIVPRDRVEDYINEADSILIGPGLPREEGIEAGDDDTKELTERLFSKYPNKKWVVDGGSLQVITPDLLPKTSIITPHRAEFKKLFGVEPTDESAKTVAEKYGIVVLLKGEHDTVASSKESVIVSGGNAGMTKGGTGDVLAGLVASLYAKNDAYLSACAASYINKKAGESLEKKMGIYFNGSDLALEIPIVMKDLL